MLNSLGYNNVTSEAGVWLSNMSPILLLLGGLVLSLVLAGIGLSLFSGASASRGGSPDRGVPSGVSPRLPGRR